ncbi:MAG: hypothetical protein GY696_15725, partial [Gammaproteobacteria bacterium]|nr:hypothetical protein [Gammaproteobacteria bacterium]
VAIDGNNVLIGAPGDDDKEKESGSAYLFNISNGKQLKKFLPPHEERNANFGQRVALHGQYAVIAPDYESGGRAYIYNINSYIPKSTAYLWKLVGNGGKSAEGSDGFGYSVSISGDNVLVGAPRASNADGIKVGAAYLFNASTGEQIHRFRANDSAKQDYFGYDVSISGNYAVVSAPYHDQGGVKNAGSVYLFDISTGRQIKKYTAFDSTAGKHFGRSVAIDGGNLLVGSKGSVYFSGQCKK